MANADASSEPGPSRKKKFTPEDFDFDKIIGEGQFSQVWLATEKKSHAMVAIKVTDGEVRKKENIDRYLWMESFVHNQLKHPNVIRRFTSFHVEKTLYFVLEYAANGSLHDIMQRYDYRRIPENLAAKYTYQTASGLIACHNIGFMHGDLKPENVLVDHHDNAKLSDFGLSWPSYCGKERGYRGTREYMAPEVMREGAEYNMSIDFWSLGVLCLEILSGKYPFKSTCLKTTRNKIDEGRYNNSKFVPLDAMDLISKLIVVKPRKRLPLQEVIAHPWIQKNYLDQKPTEEE